MLLGCAPAPCLRSPALGETQGQAASLRPGMQPARAAPCPNQFEPAAGMEPWRVPTSSLWRPSPAQSCASGLLLGSPPRVQAAGSLPAWGVGGEAPWSHSRSPLAGPQGHTPCHPPHPHPASPPATKWLPVCVFSRSILPVQASGIQGSRLAMVPKLGCTLETPGKVPENTDAQSPPQRL